MLVKFVLDGSYFSYETFLSESNVLGTKEGPFENAR